MVMQEMKYLTGCLCEFDDLLAGDLISLLIDPVV
jgi:hypothetical protein